MIGNYILSALIIIELVFIVFSITKRSDLKKEKSGARLILFGIFLLLTVSSVIRWGFQWFTLAIFLGIQTIFAGIVLLRKQENTASRRSKLAVAGLFRTLLIILVMLPVLIFPQYKEISPTGEYQVGTKVYTLIDESREETFTEEKDYRKLTIQYWYPVKMPGQTGKPLPEKFPLVVFSHGAFGYRMSNYSTYQELASHGYIVASIDHTYHAFLTEEEDGKAITGDMNFIKDAMKAQNGEYSPEKMYELEQEWMKLRTADMAFILDYIRKTASSAKADTVYQSIDLEHVGVMGHSLGGATAAKMGREDQNIDAVIVIDGTMMGEIVGFEGGKDKITDVPYPIPIMNIYNESHYEEAFQNADYANTVAHKLGLDSYQVVMKGSGHMNFTDLPIISPFLSGMLGTGSVDAKYCIEKTNEIILQFFDHYLKSVQTEMPRERTF